MITYANLDDQPLISGRPGWISQLHQNLQVRVAQLSGKQVAVVKQSDSATSAEVEAEVLKQIPNAKTVVSVLSPPFAQSGGCHRLVDSFWKSATDSGQFAVDNRCRLLNVVKTPVENDALPPELQSLYTGLVPYEFFERDPQSGRLREFDEAFGDTAMQRFHERVYDVAYDVSQVLKYLGDTDHAGEKRTANPKTIFLAATTSDLEPQRDQLRRELIELGHDVVPKQPLPLVASELISVVARVSGAGRHRHSLCRRAFRHGARSDRVVGGRAAEPGGCPTLREFRAAATDLDSQGPANQGRTPGLIHPPTGVRTRLGHRRRADRRHAGESESACCGRGGNASRPKSTNPPPVPRRAARLAFT